MKATYECDYDKNRTSLYEAIEEKAWIPVLYFFKTGKWERGLFFAEVEDPLPASRQVRTWITRFEPDGKVRWSQLPLHAAIIFNAPFQIVSELVKLYPQAARCTDDQHMLPLHLAIKYGSEDGVVLCLLDTFPESIFTKDIRGRLPTEVEGPRSERSKIIEQTIKVMTKTLTKRHGTAMNENIADMKDDLALQKNLNADLEREKKELEEKFYKMQAELDAAQERLHQFREGIKKKSGLMHGSIQPLSRNPASSSERSAYQHRSPSTVPSGGSRSIPRMPRQESPTPKSIVFGKLKGGSVASTDSSSGKIGRRGFLKGFGSSRE